MLRFNHMEITVPKGHLTAHRDEIKHFYGEVFGFESLDVPFDGGRLLVNPATIRFLPTPVADDGSLALEGLLPKNPALCGASLFYQMMFRDQGAAGRLQLAMTNGLHHVFGH